jgi:hypothetical protein
VGVKVINPKTGPAAGGTSVSIGVTGLDEDTWSFSTVMFGANEGSNVSFDGWDEATKKGTITAVSPPGQSGTVDVKVISPSGKDHWTDPKSFTYK